MAENQTSTLVLGSRTQSLVSHCSEPLMLLLTVKQDKGGIEMILNLQNYLALNFPF